MNGYQILATKDLLGRPKRAASTSKPSRSRLPAIAGGILGAAVGGAHPVLSAIVGSALVGAASDYARGEVTLGEAGRSFGRVAVGAAASVAMPGLPLVGYGVGRIIGNAVFGAWTPAPSWDDVLGGKANLEKGMQGSSVARLQYLLRMPADDQDGKYGDKTLTAVKRFQESQGLRFEGGTVGANTVHALEGSLAADTGAGRTIPQVADATRSSVAPRTSTEVSSRAAGSGSGSGSATTNATDLQTGTKTSVLDAAKAAVTAPLWEGSSLTRWQGALLGVGGAAVLWGGISLLRNGVEDYASGGATVGGAP